MAAHRSRQSPLSSPETAPAHYDPFDPPLNPIEMEFIPQPSWEPWRGQRKRSPGRHSWRTHSAPSTPRSSPRPSPDPSPRRSPETSSHAELLHREAGVSDSPPKSRSPAQTSVRTFESSFFRKKSHPDAQALLDRRAREIAKWHIHWETPTYMILLFLLGVIGAVSHHIYYKSLDGKPAENQLTMVRYGTALAFFIKACLVGSVVLSYRQRIWQTFREKPMTISAIDALFAVCDDFSKFTSLEMLRNAKLASLMALATWLIPIAAVLSPASLTSEIRTLSKESVCPSVATLNFTMESSYNFRDAGNWPGSSLLFYNTTSINKVAGYFDYYDQPSKMARRLSRLTAYLGRPSSSATASNVSCAAGWNCTYTISFVGPGYNCLQVAYGVGANNSGLAAINAPFDTSILVPSGGGNYIYLSDVDTGEYPDPQLPTDSHGEPIQKEPPWPEDLGVFKAEPVIWIGHSINTNNSWPPGSPYANSRWPTERIPVIFRCEHYETNYTITMNYTNGIQHSNVIERNFLRPIINTTITPNPANASDPSIGPASNYIFPHTDVGLYKLTAAYHSLGALLRSFLSGTIDDESSFPRTKSDISDTRLIDAETSYPVPDLMTQVQSVYEDMIITLLSEPHLVIASNTSVPCRKSRTLNVFQYHASSLWIGYAIVVGVALLFLVIGGVSMVRNGVASDTLFSRIMVTTRNPTLDRLSVGACLGNDPFPEELNRTKLRFGVLLEEDDSSGLGSPRLQDGLMGRVEHCSFGTEGETKPIVKYGTYAGLQKWRGSNEWE